MAKNLRQYSLSASSAHTRVGKMAKPSVRASLIDALSMTDGRRDIENKSAGVV